MSQGQGQAQGGRGGFTPAELKDAGLSPQDIKELLLAQLQTPQASRTIAHTSGRGGAAAARLSGPQDQSSATPSVPLPNVSSLPPGAEIPAASLPTISPTSPVAALAGAGIVAAAPTPVPTSAVGVVNGQPLTWDDLIGNKKIDPNKAQDQDSQNVMGISLKVSTWDKILKGATIAGNVAIGAATTVGLTFGLARLGFASNVNPDQIHFLYPWASLSVALVPFAIGMRWCASKLRLHLHDQVAGKLDLRKQSFDDPDQMYSMIKEVFTTIGRTMGFSKDQLEQIENVIEVRTQGNDLIKKFGNDLENFSGISNELRQGLIDCFYPGSFGFKVNERAANDPAFKARFDAELQPGSPARNAYDKLLEDDKKIQTISQLEDQDKIKAIGLLFREADLENRKPTMRVQRMIDDQKAALRKIGGGTLGDELADMYLLGRFEEKVKLRFGSDALFRLEMDKRFKLGSSELDQLREVFGKDLEIAKIDTSRRRTRRTLGLSDEERIADEQRSTRGGLFRNWLFTFPGRPYTSTPINPTTWNLLEFDLGKKIEIFSTALKNIWENKEVFKGVGKLTQTQIKSLIAQELNELNLKNDAKEARVGEATVIVPSLQIQLAERYNLFYLLFDKAVTTLSKPQIATPVIIGTGLFGWAIDIANKTPALWNAMSPVLRALDAVF